MYCPKNCSCSLCRELHGLSPAGKAAKRQAPRPPNSLLARLNDNFILRRRSVNSIKSFQPKSLKCSEMFQQRAHSPSRPISPLSLQDCKGPRSLATPSPTPISQHPDASGQGCGSASDRNKSNMPSKVNHKVVIYFGDSIDNRNKHNGNGNSNLNNNKNNENFSQTNGVNSSVNNNARIVNERKIAKSAKNPAKVLQQSTNNNLTRPDCPIVNELKNNAIANENDNDNELPPYIEIIENGVINIKIEGNYQHASALVEKVSKPTRAFVGQVELATPEDAPSQADSFDWSFVQQWRARPTSNMSAFNGQQQQVPNIPNTPPHKNSTPKESGISAQQQSNNGVGLAPVTNTPVGGTSMGRIQNPAVAIPAPRVYKEVARPGGDFNGNTNGNILTTPNKSVNIVNIENYQEQHDGNSQNVTPNAVDKSGIVNSGIKSNLIITGNNAAVPHRSITAPTRLTVQSTPVKSQPPMLSSNLIQQTNVAPSQKTSNKRINVTTNLNGTASIGIPIDNNFERIPNLQKSNFNTRTHHHEFRSIQRIQECHSSSDENRSSGHASMSDTGGHGSSSPGGGIVLGPLPEDRLAAGVTSRSTRSRASSNHSRVRHRATPAKMPWSGSGLEDIKLAIQQLTMRSQTSTSTYSSLSAGSESSEPARRLNRYSSLETVNTSVTTADEFIWVDSHNRLVELQHPPWSQNCIMRVIRNGRCKEQADQISIEIIPRLSYLLQRALVRIAREIQRLASNFGLCSKQEVVAAFKIILCPALADSCIKACLRAAAMFVVPGDSALKQSKSTRAGLQLSIGRFHRWMTDAKTGKFIHEYAAVYLCGGIENLLEEILLQCLPTDGSTQLTVNVLDHAIGNSGDFWSLLQPFAHLNAGRIASGALTMPRWASLSSLGAGTHQSNTQNANNANLESCLLTTCVGSISELKDLTFRAQQKFKHTTLSNIGLCTLYYFMRCSQLENNDVNGQAGGHSTGSTQNTQELCYERAYIVLPPLVEWLRVASAHAEYRNSVMIDKDDIMQAARLLLPGVDCPIRPIGHDEELPTKKTHFTHNGATTPIPQSVSENITELGKRSTIALAFKLMLTGRAELLAQASNLLPATTRYDTLNHAGMTALMIASIRNDDVVIQALLDAGCDPNIEVPAVGHPNCPAIHVDTQHWTAVTFAASRANYLALRLLLERGGKVEGGARLVEDKLTLTPLQVACGSGDIEVVSLLLAHGANAFLCTQQRDTMCFAGSAQRGCFSAISVAAAHGQRICLRKLLSTPMSPGSKDVLSLEEMLAEGDSGLSKSQSNNDRAISKSGTPTTLNKAQIKSLQEAMYHSAENNHLDITIELRTLGVPWTLHCWMHALAAAHELRLDAVIDQLLQDFLQVCPDDYSVQFISECLPLLFNIFRYSKNEGTTLLLADIFATCFGWESIKPIKESMVQPINASRIDPKFVNNPELSDVTFRVEGKIFYGHKIVLVTASPRFQSMLSSKVNDNNTPTVQINDIRYHIFQLVMQYLYSGGCNALDISHSDVLELMAAASFFHLEGLLRYTEAKCSEMIDIDNVVALYIHAKVYNANKLLEYCQGFLLQNMVALLTYDDSVKRLLFAKKIPNHDVLSGLLHTLQQRIKQRKCNNVNNFRPQLNISPTTSKQ